MTSSGTYNYSLNNGEALLAAFERCQIRAPSLRQEHMRTARRELNLLLSEFSNRQVNLWEVQLVNLPLVSGTATYTLPAKTIMILDAYLSINSGTSTQTDRIITPISRSDYASYAVKTTPGQPTVFWFDRLITPTLTIYPVINNSTSAINYYAALQIQDGNLADGSTPDIPYRWYDALVAGMAYRLSRTYAPQMEQLRKTDYAEAWAIAAAQDTENVPLKINMNMRRYYK